MGPKRTAEKKLIETDLLEHGSHIGFISEHDGLHGIKKVNGESHNGPEPKHEK